MRERSRDRARVIAPHALLFTLHYKATNPYKKKDRESKREGKTVHSVRARNRDNDLSGIYIL